MAFPVRVWVICNFIRASFHQTIFGKRLETVFTDDDVIQNADTKNITTFNETSGYGEVFLAGRRIT
jgi:hypothetical protein